MVTAVVAIATCGACACALAYVIGRWCKPPDRITKNVRKVRLHLQSGVQMDRRGDVAQFPGPTIEGLLAGTRQIGSIQHYVLYEPRVLETTEDGARITGTSPSGHMEIPTVRVEAVEVLGA